MFPRGFVSTSLLGGVLVCLLVLLARGASAQPVDEPGSASPGLEISPLARAGWVHDSNILLEDETQYEQPDSGHALVGGAGLEVSYVPNERWSGRFKSELTTLQYFADDSAISDLSWVGGVGEVALVFSPIPSLSLELGDRFVKDRSRRGLEQMREFSRSVNEASFGLQARFPPLLFAFRYTRAVDVFLEDAYHVLPYRGESSQDWWDLSDRAIARASTTSGETWTSTA